MVLIGAIVIAVILAGGCGGDGDEPASDERAVGEDIQAGAQERAEAIVLRLSDFPPGWRASPPADEEQADFNECVEVDVDFSGVTVNGRASSDDFSMGEVTEVSSAAAVFESEQAAQDLLVEAGRGMRDLDTDCLHDLFQEAVEEEERDVEIGMVEVGELSFTVPDEVDDGRAWQFVIPIQVQGLSPTFYVEMYLLRENDAMAALITVEVSDPFDTELRDQLLAVMAERLQGQE